MSELYETCRAQFDALTASIMAKLEDRLLSLREITALAREFAQSAVLIAEPLAGHTGAEKKSLVLEAAAEWWDTDLEPLDLPGPDWIIDPAGRTLLLFLVGFACDLLAQAYKVCGWPLVPQGTA